MSAVRGSAERLRACPLTVPRREGTVMGGTEMRTDHRWAATSRPYWLPPYGVGNGLAAAAWAPIADLSEHEAFAMLTACARTGIAAFTGPRDGGRPRPAVYRVWVDSQHFGAAEDALRAALVESRQCDQPSP